ncbi:hypothetical protein Daus18300_001065 [Diaporthe australafricana]|uniref:FAD-binding domain-containing protein n=1 Tax=Diaporthe australafricana TaxID=127596 RepID=A0ABR3XZ20_9PEZI
MGLLHRGMTVTVYEQAADFHEIGAGFAFTGVARRCMESLNPSILEAFRRIGDENKHPQNRYWDGFNPQTKQESESEEDSLLFQLSTRDMAYWGCLRSHFLDELAKEMPEGIVQFKKTLQDLVDDEDGNGVTLYFTDGSEAKHEVVVPIEGGIAALGEEKAKNQCMHMGPDSHMLTYPLANWTLLNIVVFLTDPSAWDSSSAMTAPGSKAEVVKTFSTWSPAVKAVVDLLPEDLVKWAIFDMAEHPAPTYAYGRVCLAGDAAHASSPHHGAGAGAGVEDALALVTALESLSVRMRSGDGGTLKGREKAQAIANVLQAYSDVRYERTQWLVRSSRETGNIYQWAYPEAGRDAAKCKAQVESRTRIIWDFDVQAMVAQVKERVGLLSR